MYPFRLLCICAMFLWGYGCGGEGGEPAPDVVVGPSGSSLDSARPLPVGLVNTFGGVQMVRVPAGTFSMGLDKGPEDQNPARDHYTDAFHLDRYEVTNALYYQFWIAPDGGNRQRHTPASHGDEDGIGNWPDRAQSRPNFPVVGVTWFAAEAYCKWREVRLPTEAEWEKAARGDEAREPYPWNKGISGALANYRDGGDGYDNTLAPVGSYVGGVSFYGAMDLVGNVWEWCADYYDPNFYKVSPVNNPNGPTEGQFRVIRGGSWRTAADQIPNRLSITYRGWADPNGATDGWGIRCARDLD